MRGDDQFMRMALDEASRGRGLTNPNPAVGAVIVRRGVVVGKGYHKKCGQPHAEIHALRRAGARARGATMYVTLEPCDHIGRTGPCTEAVIAAGISRVVVAMKDPNPLTDGKGIRRLRRHGIITTVGLLEKDAKALNAPFIKFIRHRLPYVTVKMAQSLDGKIATRTGDSRWVSSEESRRLVHGLRGRVDAVMVGVNTVKRDDPRLLSVVARKQPARIIVDSRLSTPLDSRILRTTKAAPLYIAVNRAVDPARARPYEKRGARVLYLDGDRGRVDLGALMRALAELDIMHVLCEGGGELVAGLIEKKLADELLFFVAPKLIGGRGAVTSMEGHGARFMRQAWRVSGMTAERCGEDILIRGHL